MRGEQLLGVLLLKTPDFPWLFCDFTPTPAFEDVRSYFDDELKLLEADAMDAWERAYKRVNSLGLRLIDVENEKDVGEFILHIRGNEAWFRS